MASVVSPLMSIDASGTVGKAIVFSKWKGRNYVRQHAVPHNPRSNLQYAQRAMMRFLSRIWATLSAGDKALWETYGEAINASPFNGFVKHNMDRWTQAAYPIKTPGNANGTGATVQTPTWTGGKRQITVTQDITTLNHQWGMLVTLNTSTVTSDLNKQFVKYAHVAATGMNTIVVTGLTPGTWNGHLNAFKQNGVGAIFSANSGNITVT